MDATEIEAALEELEQRVERLRALYEQYFLGIEKIEPAVLRKDVERRFWILRRTQIRNTAMRFKLNTVNQRYNTYQQYWQRSVREIEAGTYRRHVLRAEKRFGQDALTITARKRFARVGAESTEEMDEREERARKALEQVTDLDSFDDIDFGDPDVFSVPRAPVQAPAVVPAHGLDELDDLESLMGLDAGPTVSGVPRSVPPGPRTTKPGPRPPAPSRKPSSPTGPAKAADDFGDIGGLFAEDGNDRTAPHVRLPLPTAPAPAPGLRHAPSAPRPSAAPQQPSQPLPPPKLPPLPVPPLRPSQPRAPQRPSQPQAPQAPQVPQPHAPPRSPQAAAQRPLPVPPPRVPAPQRPSQPQPPERTSQPQRPSPPQPAQRPPQGAAPASGLSDERVREIYRDYVNAKRQCNESTSAITEASLAQSLRGSADKLSEKHKGRRIDYEVVIKDGRAVLKPVVKS